MKFLFFFMGVPLMIMSFFEAIDVLPYATQANIIVDGNAIEISEEQQDQLFVSIQNLFENSKTMPAFGVTTPEMFEEELKSGTFVSMKFDSLFEVNGLPFDELVFRVDRDYHAFNLVRGVDGVFGGRCIYIDLDEKDMSEFDNFVKTLVTEQTSNLSQSQPQKEEPAQDLESLESEENSKDAQEQNNV